MSTFCILPWAHLHVDPKGNVLPCCVGDPSQPLGSIVTQEVNDIINGDAAKQLRKNLLSGVRDTKCNYCYQIEDQGQTSPRQATNSSLNDKYQSYVDNTNPDGSIEKFQPYYIDIRPSNICNLKCRWCSEYYSSAIEYETNSLQGKTHIPITKDDRAVVFEKIKDYLKTITKIYFAGGEPLLMNDHYRILDELLRIGHTKVFIHYSTNLTNLYFKDKCITDYWNQLKNVFVNASLDAEGRAAEYIRDGTVWANIENNIRTIQKESPHVKIRIYSTLGFMNTDSLIALQKSLIEHFNIAPEHMNIGILMNPGHQNLRTLPVHHKKRLANNITKHLDWLSTVNNSQSLTDQWKNIIDYMFGETDIQLNMKLFTDLDTIRQQSFINVFPEFADLFDPATNKD